MIESEVIDIINNAITAGDIPPGTYNTATIAATIDDSLFVSEVDDYYSHYSMNIWDGVSPIQAPTMLLTPAQFISKFGDPGNSKVVLTSLDGIVITVRFIDENGIPFDGVTANQWMTDWMINAKATMLGGKKIQAVLGGLQ